MYKNFNEVKNALASGKSVLDILETYLQAIESKKHLNAFLEVFEDSAREQAKKVDEKIANGTAGKLAGMVIGIKDNICYKGHHVTASSKILEGFESLFTATALQRLLDEDAVVIGRLNCDEFAMGSSNENSAFGNVLNPLDEKCVPGGSSGGSAASVAANLCTISLGSDTGGSIRQPASFTGTYGIKPTYGRISRYGLIAYASSFDQIGCFANDLEDVALVTEIMAGEDEMDSTSSSEKVTNYSVELPTKKLKFAYLKEGLEIDSIQPEIKEQFLTLIEQLKNDGHEVNEIQFPYLDYLVPTYYVLSTAEASSNLSRFDGVHYGHQAKESNGIDDLYKKSRSEGFGPEVKRRIMAGTFVLSQGYKDAYYSKAQKVRRLLQEKTNEILTNNDCILMPTSPIVAFEQNAITNPIEMYLQDIYTVFANLTGHPAISIPHQHKIKNLPFGIQLTGQFFKEDDLFRYSKLIENYITN